MAGAGAGPAASPWPALRVCLAIGILSLWIFLGLCIEKTDFSLFVPRVQIEPRLASLESSKGFLVNTAGCRIPDLDPMDPAIRQYVTLNASLDCAARYGPALVESNLTCLTVRQSALAHYNVSDPGQLNCCYTPFWRVELPSNPSKTYPSRVDVTIRYANYCIPFHEAVRIPEEFVKTVCYVNNNSVYIDYHAFTPIKTNIQIKLSKKQDAVSVLVFGVDAVSRLNLHRQMPSTIKFLKNTLGAVEMLGYNKVDDNTFPNLMPVLTGLSEKEMKDSCWPTSHSVFDECPFIWSNFSAAGYQTAFGEDATWMGIFTYLKRGFRKQPTDYYMKVFTKISEEEIGSEKRSNAKLCVGPRKALESLINYAFKFSVTLKDMLSFGFFWGASLTHDYLNYPKLGDNDHKEFLEKLHQQGVFNNTILVFMSDHGIRWGTFRGTYQGFLEERLPFLFIAYPDQFRLKYTTAVSNLKKNSRKLTTPFDLHETLLNLVDVRHLEKDVLMKRSHELSKSGSLPRGISLFLPIPESRSCSDAGIVDHWCTCHQSVSVPTNSTYARKAASYLVKHLNALLKDYIQCAKLKLNSVLNAREEKSTSHSNFKVSDAGMRDLSITIETTPGLALFEATIRHNGNTDSYGLVGSISRINLYGDQSRCVHQYNLRLYCYCIHD